MIGLNDGAGARIQEASSRCIPTARSSTETCGRRCHPPGERGHGPLRRRGRLLPGHDRLHLHGERHLPHVHHRSDVVKTVTGEDVTLEELGGAMSHATKSGVATFVAPDEKTCSTRSAICCLPPLQQPRGDPDRRHRRRPRPGLPRARRPDARIGHPALRHEEGHRCRRRRRGLLRGPSPLGHVHHLWLRPHRRRSVGIVGNQPPSSPVSSTSTRRRRRPLRADLRRLQHPLVTFVDVPGFMPEPTRSTAASSATGPSSSTPTARRPSPHPDRHPQGLRRPTSS